MDSESLSNDADCMSCVDIEVLNIHPFRLNNVALLEQHSQTSGWRETQVYINPQISLPIHLYSPASNRQFKDKQTLFSIKLQLQPPQCTSSTLSSPLWLPLPLWLLLLLLLLRTLLPKLRWIVPTDGANVAYVSIFPYFNRENEL